GNTSMAISVQRLRRMSFVRNRPQPPLMAAARCRASGVLSPKSTRSCAARSNAGPASGTSGRVKNLSNSSVIAPLQCAYPTLQARKVADGNRPKPAKLPCDSWPELTPHPIRIVPFIPQFFHLRIDFFFCAEFVTRCLELAMNAIDEIQHAFRGWRRRLDCFDAHLNPARRHGQLLIKCQGAVGADGPEHFKISSRHKKLLY